MTKILAFAGSTRVDSLNKKLVKAAAAGARAAGAEVTILDLRDVPMPLYDGDLEQTEGLSPNVKAFRELMKSHHGLLISCPEYNSSISGVLKNAFDWASRPVPSEQPLLCFTGKICSLMAASPGALGGLRGLVAVRSLLGNIGVIVLPDQVAVPKAHEAFNPDGTLKDAALRAQIEKLGATTVQVAAKLAPGR